MLFIQEETAYNEDILPQYRDNYLCDCPCYIRSRKILCNQVACRVEQLTFKTPSTFQQYLLYLCKQAA
jgi:hypothetical protein